MRSGLVGARGPWLTMSLVIQMMGSVSEAVERNDSVEVGDKDIGRVRATGTLAKWTRTEGRITARGGKGIYWGLAVESLFSSWAL